MTLAVPAMLCIPLTAQAQNDVNPNLPMNTQPPGPQNPALPGPGNPFPPQGVIKPPPMANTMPIIRPQTPSRMPVIAPPGTPGGNPNVIAK